LYQVSGKPHVIRFMEGFTTLTINGHPFRADFGGFPMVVSLQLCFFIFTGIMSPVEFFFDGM
jgi:hypothetical protein